MARRLLLAPFSAHDATDRLLRAALERVPGPDFRDILYLCPSPRKLRDTQSRFTAICGRSACYPPRFFTPGQLCRDLHDRFGAGARFPSGLRPLLVRRLLAGTERPTLGYARAVGDFIRDVKTWVPDRSRLRQEFEDELAGFERPLARALEALDLLERYDAELASRGRVDDEDAWQVAAGLVGERFRPGVLVLDGFAAPNPLESRLLRALIEASDHAFAACPAGDEADEDYALARGFREFVESLGGFETESLEPGPAPDPGGLRRFPDPEAEIAGVCRYLRALPDLADTVVAMPDLAGRAPMVRRLFDQYGLPVTTYPERLLEASAPVADVLELLRALDNGYERLPTATALSSPWLPGLMRLPGESDPGPRARAASALDHLSRRAGIIKGRTDWEHIRARLESNERHPGEELARFLQDVQDRVRQAIGLAERILDPADTLGRQAARLKQFLEAVDFCRDEPAFGSDRGSLYDLLDALRGFDADFGSEPEPRAGFVRALEYLVGLCPSRADPDPAGVLVVNLNQETMGLHPRRVVCAGLTEANLPGGYRSDPIIPERLLRRLGMPGMDRHRDWQRFHLRRTVESARGELFLSFHDSADGKPVLPTPFLELEPVSPAPVEVFYAPAEEQLDRGRRGGRPFAENARTVDFSRDLDVRAALGRRFGPDRVIPVTGIESYRQCPYRFYLERVLGLDSPPEPQYEVDAAQWGTVIHRCLQLLYERGPVPLARLEERARAALDRALRDSGLPLFWAETTRRVFDHFLPAFVEIERGLREQGFSPKWTERRIEGQVADGIRVAGRLDRLDEGRDSLRVLDYKTGAAGISARQVLEDRTHVQLPLYCRLVQGETGKPVDNCGVYSTRDRRVRWLADGKHPLDELVRAALEATVEALAAIRSGEFPSRAADSQACRNCDYAYLCTPDTGAED